MNYDQKNWKLLLIQFITKPEDIHVLNRAQIIDDAYHLSRAGSVPYDYYVALLEYLLMENHVTPWNTATGGLSEIMGGIRRYPAEYCKFKVKTNGLRAFPDTLVMFCPQEYAKGLADILYGKFGTDGTVDGGSTEIGRGRLLAWACRMGDERCEKTASEHFDAWMNGQR